MDGVILNVLDHLNLEHLIQFSYSSRPTVLLFPGIQSCTELNSILPPVHMLSNFPGLCGMDTGLTLVLPAVLNENRSQTGETTVFLS